MNFYFKKWDLFALSATRFLNIFYTKSCNLMWKIQKYKYIPLYAMVVLVYLSLACAKMLMGNVNKMLMGNVNKMLMGMLTKC